MWGSYSEAYWPVNSEDYQQGYNFCDTTMPMKRVRGDRIADLMAEQGVSQAALAREVGITQPTINNLIHGGSQSSKHLPDIARVLRTSVAYLRNETDDPASDAAPEPDPAEVAARYGLELVKKYDVQLSAGGGAFALTPLENGGYRAFDGEWLRSELRRRADQLGVFKVAGDSMEPELRDGDSVLVDLTATRPAAHGLYALRYGDIVMVKRLAISRSGREVTIISSNPVFPSETAQVDDVHLIGRVVWLGRRVG